MARIGTAEDVYNLLCPRSIGIEVEKFWVLSLNRKNHLLKAEEVTQGTATASLVHPRETFRTAIGHGAATGSPSTSTADHAVTRNLKKASYIRHQSARPCCLRYTQCRS